MKDMLKYENDTWTINTLMLAYLLDETAHLALKHFRKTKKSHHEELVHGLVKTQFQTLIQAINMANEVYGTTDKPTKPRLKLVKTKAKTKV
jgi:hypothetical protein